MAGAMRRGAAALVAAAMATSLAACGGGGGSPPTPPGSGSGTGTGDAVEQATHRLCNDLLLIQSGFRPDALGRLAPKLAADAAAFAAAGDRKTAGAVRDFSKAIAKLRTALLQHQGVNEAQNAVVRSLEDLPSC